MAGTSGGYGSYGYGGFGGFGGQQRQSTYEDEEVSADVQQQILSRADIIRRR